MSHHFLGFAHFSHGPGAQLVLLLILAVALAAIVKNESSKQP